MSKEIAKIVGLKIGEKVLFPHGYGSFNVEMNIVTIKDIRLLPGDRGDESEVVIDVEEFDGYLYPSNVYSLDQIKRMFDQA